jgi:hypothetical protein
VSRLRVLARRHEPRVWLTWAVGVAALAAAPVAIADPAVLVFVLDPELLALVAGTAILLLRGAAARLMLRAWSAWVTSMPFTRASPTLSSGSARARRRRRRSDRR